MACSPAFSKFQIHTGKKGISENHIPVTHWSFIDMDIMDTGIIHVKVDGQVDGDVDGDGKVTPSLLLLDLPYDLIINILSFLPRPALMQSRLLNKCFYETIMEDSRLWTVIDLDLDIWKRLDVTPWNQQTLRVALPVAIRKFVKHIYMWVFYFTFIFMLLELKCCWSMLHDQRSQQKKLTLQ